MSMRESVRRLRPFSRVGYWKDTARWLRESAPESFRERRGVDAPTSPAALSFLAALGVASFRRDLQTRLSSPVSAALSARRGPAAWREVPFHRASACARL